MHKRKFCHEKESFAGRKKLCSEKRSLAVSKQALLCKRKFCNEKENGDVRKKGLQWHLWVIIAMFIAYSNFVNKTTKYYI